MKFQVYKDKINKWRWKLKQDDGKLVAMCSEGYKNKQDMLDTMMDMVGGLVQDFSYNPFPWTKGNSLFYEEGDSMNGH